MAVVFGGDDPSGFVDVLGSGCRDDAFARRIGHVEVADTVQGTSQQVRHHHDNGHDRARSAQMAASEKCGDDVQDRDPFEQARILHGASFQVDVQQYYEFWRANTKPAPGTGDWSVDRRVGGRRRIHASPGPSTAATAIVVSRIDEIMPPIIETAIQLHGLGVLHMTDSRPATHCHHLQTRCAQRAATIASLKAAAYQLRGRCPRPR